MLRDSLTRIGERRAAEYAQGRRPVEAVQAAFEDGGYDPIVETDAEGLKIRVPTALTAERLSMMRLSGRLTDR